jgi:hypothetical protein
MDLKLWIFLMPGSPNLKVTGKLVDGWVLRFSMDEIIGITSQEVYNLNSIEPLC